MQVRNKWRNISNRPLTAHYIRSTHREQQKHTRQLKGASINNRMQVACYTSSPVATAGALMQTCRARDRHSSRTEESIWASGGASTAREHGQNMKITCSLPFAHGKRWLTLHYVIQLSWRIQARARAAATDLGHVRSHETECAAEKDGSEGTARRSWPNQGAARWASPAKKLDRRPVTRREDCGFVT
jgi:hypothetical protein